MLSLKRFLIIGALASSFLYGAISTKYELFPFKQLSLIRMMLIGKSLNPDDAFIAYPEWHIQTKNFSTQTASAEIIMVGDSITAGGKWKVSFPNKSIINRGIGGDTSYGITKRLDTIVNTNANKAFILVGINDITGKRSTQAILKDYAQILETLNSNKINPIIQSTIYVSNCYPSNKLINTKVKLLNSKLSDYAKKNNFVFLDINAQLSHNEYLKSEYTTDGMHLNQEGYKVLIKLISAYL